MFSHSPYSECPVGEQASSHRSAMRNPLPSSCGFPGKISLRRRRVKVVGLQLRRKFRCRLNVSSDERELRKNSAQTEHDRLRYYVEKWTPREVEYQCHRPTSALLFETFPLHQRDRRTVDGKRSTPKRTTSIQKHDFFSSGHFCPPERVH